MRLSRLQLVDWKKVLTQLRNKQLAESTKKSTDIGALILNVVEQRNVQFPQISTQISLDRKVSIDEETFASVLNHLLQNAQEATNDDGWVKIIAETVENNLHITILDNGCGMSAEFIS